MNYLEIYGSMRTFVTIVAAIVLLKYYVYLVLAPFYELKKELWKLAMTRKVKKGKIDKEYSPLVSVIIPAWNEEVGILTTVRSVLLNTYNNIEIIVVNDGSTDRTDAIMKKFVEVYQFHPVGNKKVRYFYKPNGGKGSALNYGIQESRGEIVVTMDADSAHRKDAVYNLVSYFKDPSIDAVVGNVKVANSKNIVGLMQKFEYLFGFYFKRVHSLFDAEYIFGGACAAFRKSTTFDAIGYFDELNKTEDIEYSMRCKLYGLKSVYAEDVVTYTEGASTLTGLYKQRLRWKKGRIDTFVKYRGLFFSTHKKHSKFLSWMVLPYALLGEMQMLLEPIFFTLVWSYTFLSGDYLTLGISSLFILFTFVAALVFGDKDTNPFWVLLFPFLWPLFYILVGVEYLALMKSIELILGSQDVVWQKWSRAGIQRDIRIDLQKGALA